jgi:hypothetical protein
MAQRRGDIQTKNVKREWIPFDVSIIHQEPQRLASSPELTTNLEAPNPTKAPVANFP